MKIVTFWGGLGNQIIEFAYYEWLKEKCPKDKIYGFYPKAGLKSHNGLEIEKRFDVVLPPKSLLTNIWGYSLFYLDKILVRMGVPQFFTCTLKHFNIKKTFHCDSFQDINYMPKNFCINFKQMKLNNKNKELLELLERENSVAVHVRRGDYLNPNTLGLYGGICTDNYYNKSIDIICKEVNNPHFVFFSNDPAYCKNTYKFDNMTVVDWNTGEDSFIDMYLMAHCKYMVLANSTFSYWAARLNKHVQKVICPIRRCNEKPGPNLTLPDWVEVEP